MKKKSILSLLLVLAMVLALMAGCGTTADTSEVPASEPEPAASESVQDAVPPAEEAPTAEADASAAEAPESEPAAEYGECAISFPLDETETLTYWHDVDSRILTYIPTGVIDDAPAFVAAEEATNVHIKHIGVGMDAESDQFNLMVASGDYTDLIKKATDLYSKGSIAAMDDEVIIDLAPYLEEYAPDFLRALDLVDGYVNEVTTDDGRVPTFVTVYAAGMDPSQALWIRKDLLDGIGMGIPQTYDEFTAVLTAFKDSGVKEPLYLNPTGVLPKNVLAAGYNVAVDMNFGAGAAATEPFYQVDGTVKFGALEDGWLSYIEMVRSWYADGLISSDFVSNTGNAMDAGFMSTVTTGQTAVFCAPTMLIEYLVATGKDYDPNFEVVAIADMVQNVGDMTHFGLANATAKTEGLSISTTCENPELAAAWCNYWYTETGRMLATWGQEGVTYEYNANGDPQWTELITNNPDGMSKMDASSLYTMSVGSINFMPTDTTGMAQYAIDALTTWMEHNDGAYDIPVTATFTSEESESYNDYMGEISTHYNETVLRFITGDKELSEYNTFVEELHNMGIDECIALKQSMLDRYNNR